MLRGEGRGHALRADVLVQLGSLYPVADIRTVFNQLSFLSANQKVTVTNVGQCLKLGGEGRAAGLTEVHCHS